MHNQSLAVSLGLKKYQFMLKNEFTSICKKLDIQPR